MNCDLQSIEAVRQRQLEAFYNKILVRAELNKADCDFHEISSCQNTEEIVIIVQELLTNLKHCLIKRIISKKLEESDSYQYWHKETKQIIRSLKQFIKTKLIKQFVFDCYHEAFTQN